MPCAGPIGIIFVCLSPQSSRAHLNSKCCVQGAAGEGSVTKRNGMPVVHVVHAMMGAALSEARVENRMGCRVRHQRSKAGTGGDGMG